LRSLKVTGIDSQHLHRGWSILGWDHHRSRYSTVDRK
jgi:hypothetical protein